MCSESVEHPRGEKAGKQVFEQFDEGFEFVHRLTKASTERGREPPLGPTSYFFALLRACVNAEPATERCAGVDLGLLRTLAALDATLELVYSCLGFAAIAVTYLGALRQGNAADNTR